MEVSASLYKSIIYPDALASAQARLPSAQRTMLDATLDCIKILSIDGRLLDMNRAGCLALGVSADSGFGMPWLPLLPESVRKAGVEALHKAAAGESARFPGWSEAEGKTRYWDNLLTPVVDADGRVTSILCVSRDVTTKTHLERELEEAIRREKLLTREMQHRIKNLFSVVSGLISISEKEAAKDEAAGSATGILREKIIALSRASNAAFAYEETGDDSTARADVGSLVRSVLLPYGDRYRASGSQAYICNSSTTTVALFLHEFATNSVKYGAFSVEGGSVIVSWSLTDGTLELTWTESGGPPISDAPRIPGFGSEMVERLVCSVGGRIVKAWPREGLTVELSLPKAGASRDR